MIVYNGMIPPPPLFNWSLFLLFEFTTVMIESIVLWLLLKNYKAINKNDKDDNFNFSFINIFMITSLVNIWSAVLMGFIWVNYGIGV